jgi:hypothetical protein
MIRYAMSYAAEYADYADYAHTTHNPSSLLRYCVVPQYHPNPLSPLRGLAGQDIRVTSVQHSHGRAAEQLTTSSSKLNLFHSKLATM